MEDVTLCDSELCHSGEGEGTELLECTQHDLDLKLWETVMKKCFVNHDLIWCIFLHLPNIYLLIMWGWFKADEH